MNMVYQANKMKIDYEIASPDDSPCIVDTKIEMFRNFEYDQYLQKYAHETIVQRLF
jgi:hypothetical protein